MVRTVHINCKGTYIFFIKWHQKWVSDAKTGNNRHYWIKALKNSPQYKHFPQFGFYWEHRQLLTCEIASVNGSYYTLQQQLHLRSCKMGKKYGMRKVMKFQGNQLSYPVQLNFHFHQEHQQPSNNQLHYEPTQTESLSFSCRERRQQLLRKQTSWHTKQLKVNRNGHATHRSYG